MCGLERKQGFACIALSIALFAGSLGLMGAVDADTGALVADTTAMADEGASALSDGKMSLALASLEEGEASSAYEALEEAFDGLKTYVPVGGRFTDEELEDAYNLLKKERPDLFFMDGVSYTYDKDSGKVLAIRPEYVAELSEVRDMRDEYRAAVKQALATIDGTETSAEAATKVHDWLANRTEYDYEAAEDASKASWNASSSYGCIGAWKGRMHRLRSRIQGHHGAVGGRLLICDLGEHGACVEPALGRWALPARRCDVRRYGLGPVGGVS